MNREEMTIDEAIAIIRKEYLCVDRDCDIERNCGKCDLMIPSKEPILEAYKMAIKALEQMPVTTTAGEGGVIYYPQVEGVTPTVIDAGKQEPCDTCGYEEGSIYCKEHCPYEAKMDDLVKLCIEQERDCKTCIHSDKGKCAGTERCHECMWESKYEQEPCSDSISRENAIIRISWDFPTLEISKVKESLDKLPSVNPQPKTGHWSRKTKVDAYDIAGVKTWGIKCQCDKCDFTTIVVEDFGYYKYCPNCGCRIVEPQERSGEE